MSTAPEKNRRPQSQHQRQAPSRGSGPQGNQSKSSSSSQKPGTQQPAQPPATSAWAKGASGIGRGKPVSRTSTPGSDGRQTPTAAAGGIAGPTAPASAGAAPPSSADSHVSLKGFDGRATREWLKKRYVGTVGATEGAALYKPGADNPVNKRASMGAWGAKPNAMANGQDFWSALMKQVAARDGGGG